MIDPDNQFHKYDNSDDKLSQSKERLTQKKRYISKASTRCKYVIKTDEIKNELREKIIILNESLKTAS